MKTLFITGATGGLGQALCPRFSESPCRIALHGFQNQAAGKGLIEQIRAKGNEADFYSADLREAKAIRAMFDQLQEKWGTIDLLINTAGTTKDALFNRLETEDWDDVLSVNLSGAFYCMQEAAKIMQPKGGGQIINIGSFAGKTGRIGQAAYSASKRGLIALTQSAAKEWGKDNIQVNAVCPGYLPTPMTAHLKPADAERLIGENQLRRTSSLEEVADFIHHLSTMKHVSGQVFNLDSRIG